MENTAMKLKSSEEIIKGLLLKYSRKEENVSYIENLFVAASIVRWIFRTTDKTEERLSYLAQVERFLIGEINLYWDESGTLRVGKTKKG